MTEAIGLSKPEMPDSGVKGDEPDSAGMPKKLAVMNLPPHRERPVTNLGRVFGQFAELQQQIAEQVVSLEESVYHQKQEIATAMAQLPDLRERINWLIASLYEQSKKDESVRERLDRQDATLATLVEAVRTIHQAQTQWQTALEGIIGSLVRAKSTTVPPLPEF